MHLEGKMLMTMRFAFFVSMVLLFISLSCCEKPKPSDEVFPVETLQTPEWIIYDGHVPIDQETDLMMKLAMKPARGGGAGSYVLEERLVRQGVAERQSAHAGDYSLVMGATPQELIVFLQGSAWAEGVRRRYPTPDGARVREETFRNTDLVLRRQGDHTLIVLNKNSSPLTLEPQHNLTKRTSRLFTVEGKFAHTGDSAVFLETNTGEQWPISKRGAYNEAIKGYYDLTSKKFEGIYMKAVGYSIRTSNRKGEEIDALVLERIIQMSTLAEP